MVARNVKPARKQTNGPKLSTSFPTNPRHIKLGCLWQRYVLTERPKRRDPSPRNCPLQMPPATRRGHECRCERNTALNILPFVCSSSRTKFKSSSPLDMDWIFQGISFCGSQAYALQNLADTALPANLSAGKIIVLGRNFGAARASQNWQPVRTGILLRWDGDSLERKMLLSTALKYPPSGWLRTGIPRSPEKRDTEQALKRADLHKAHLKKKRKKEVNLELIADFWETNIWNLSKQLSKHLSLIFRSFKIGKKKKNCTV